MQKTVKLYIRPNQEIKRGFAYYIDDSEFSNHYARSTDIHIADVEVMFQVPPELNADELRQRAIKTLRDQQSRIRAEAHKRVEELELKINELLLLTHIVDGEVAEGT
jgi:hypothetical protein